jgi:hypothetical protein
MSSPLIIENGQIRQLLDTRADIPLLNLGSPETLNVLLPIITRTRNVANLIKGTPGGGTIDVTTILGAIEGDILLAFGTSVKLKRVGGNLTGINSDFTLQTGKSIFLYFWAGIWREITRRA